MEQKIVFDNTNDFIIVSDISYAEISQPCIEELSFFEQKTNGITSSPKDVYSPCFIKEFNRVANKYNYQIEMSLPNPKLKKDDVPEKYRWDNPSHWSILNNSGFAFWDFDDNGDANIRWSFRIRSPESYGNFVVKTHRVIKLSSIMVRLEKLVNRPVPKNKFKKIWNEFWTSVKYEEAEKDITPILSEYKMIKAQIQNRNKIRDDFYKAYQTDMLLRIFLKDGSQKKYLRSLCEFDIFDKKKEIDDKIAEYNVEQAKIQNSFNSGERYVEYIIKWFVASNDGKHILAIKGDCESKYRYDCILLRNSEFIDESQEFDHILVTPAGIIIVETKDWKGTIDVNVDGKWVRYKDDNGSPYGVSSPIIQMRRHEQLMKSIFPNVPIHSILCFSNSSAIINGKDNISECKVINIEQLEDVLNSICKKKKYSEQEIDNIVDTIESYKINRR